MIQSALVFGVQYASHSRKLNHKKQDRVLVFGMPDTRRPEPATARSCAKPL
jgi:hypothetical protein